MSYPPKSAKIGEIIYSPFSADEMVYSITSGYVIAYTYQDDGKRRIHLMYGPGSYFPVITTFKQTPQRATYEAITAIEYTSAFRADFLDTLKRSHAFTKEILDKTINQLSIFADRVVELQLTKLEDKLLSRLQSLAKAHGVLAADNFVDLPYKLRHHHLSDMLGAERESVSRALDTLKRKQLIRVSKEGKLGIHLAQDTTTQ